MSTELEPIKDDATVVSDDVEDQQQEQPAVLAAKPLNKFYIWFAVSLVVTSIIFGLAFGLTSQYSDEARTAGIPALVAGDAGNGVGAATTDFQLTESMPHISAIDLDHDELVYIDENAGCLNVIRYTGGNDFEPLCEHFGSIRSVSIRDDNVIIADEDGIIDHYQRSDSEWLRNPGGAKRTSIISNDSPGFGKKTAFFEIFSQLVIASDENVYVYKRQNTNMWKLKKTFEMASFAVSDDHSTVAIYDSESVTVYDTSLNRWYVVDDPITYNPSSPISSVKLSEDGGIHVVSTPVDNMFTVSNIGTGELNRLIFESKIFGDAVYSVKTGCVVDAITGEYVSIDVQDADDVFDIKISEDRIVVLLEREGETMMDIYEK